MPNNSNPTEWITTKEAAELTGYTPAYFRQLIKRGRLQARKRVAGLVPEQGGCPGLC